MKYFLRLSTLLLGIALGASAVFLYQRLATQRAPEHAVPQNSQSINASTKEILRERSGSWGMMYGYKVILRADGTANYVGDKDSERPGKYKGSVSQCDFNRIAEMIEKYDYFALKDTYDGGCTDSSSSAISVVRGNERKTVNTSGMCYGSNAEKYRKLPQIFWRLESVIDGVAASIDWQPDK